MLVSGTLKISQTSLDFHNELDRFIGLPATQENLAIIKNAAIDFYDKHHSHTKVEDVYFDKYNNEVSIQVSPNIDDNMFYQNDKFYPMKNYLYKRLDFKDESSILDCNNVSNSA